MAGKKRKSDDDSDDETTTSRAARSSNAPTRGPNKHSQTVSRIKDMFEKQAQLWKYHANLMEEASKPNETSSATSTLARQPPWSNLVNSTNSSAVTVLKKRPGGGPQQLTIQMDELSNRTYEPQTSTRSNHQDGEHGEDDEEEKEDEYRSSEDEEIDEDD